MAKLAQRATAALQTNLTLMSSHLSGFMRNRAKVLPGRDSLQREGTRLMTVARMPRGAGRRYFVQFLSISIF